MIGIRTFDMVILRFRPVVELWPFIISNTIFWVAGLIYSDIEMNRFHDIDHPV